jgi:hypothetical protein
MGNFEPALGIYGKSPSIVDSEEVFLGVGIDPETGEIRGQISEAERRLDRFALQSVARSILPGSQTAKCLRVPFRKGGEVEVWHSKAHGTASFGGLITCHSVWACPVCSAKITERRRMEIQSAISAWQALGGSVALLTLTHGHTQGDRLADLVQAEQKALDRFFGCREGRSLMAALWRRGHIRAWEVTHGRRRELNNGWHPHFHILLFLDYHHSDLGQFEDWAFQVWHSACRLAGLPLPNRRYGVTLEDGSKAAAYVAKIGQEDARIPTWGLDAEMTKGHTKRAKDGETPFDFLRSCLADEDLQGRRLFSEFSGCFKGKRQLVWSRGLRDLLGVDEMSDAELASVQEDDAVLLAQINAEDWRLILRFNLRGELLELARHGWGPVERLLADLRTRGSV